MKKLRFLVGRVVFRIAFAGFIVVQVVLFGLLAAGIGTLFRSEKAIVQGAWLSLSLMAMFLIGAGSYLIFQRMTRAEFVVAESERWLAQRRHPNSPWIRRRKILKRWAVWIPAVSVVLACIFLDHTRAFSSHFFHPIAGRIIGYRVSIPLRWMISGDAPESSREMFGRS